LQKAPLRNISINPNLKGVRLNRLLQLKVDFSTDQETKNPPISADFCLNNFI